jgi:hypothetical protein
MLGKNKIIKENFEKKKKMWNKWIKNNEKENLIKKKKD